MKLSFTLTLADFKAAQRLHRRQNLSSLIAYYAFIVIPPALAVLSMLAVGVLMLFTPVHYLGGSYVIFLAFAVCLSVPFFHSYSVRQSFVRIFPPGTLDRTKSLDIDDERIISTIPGVSEGKFFWNAVMAFAQDEKITLLYVRKNIFIFIPTIALSPVERAELTDLVARQLPKGKP
ncbi:MAG: YcxB family protein [Terracidiphilus sp.]|jgi:hypothetical protein